MAREYKVLIGGEWCEAVKGERMEVTNPANGKPFASVPKCGPEDVDKAVDAALTAGSAMGFPAQSGPAVSARKPC